MIDLIAEGLAEIGRGIDAANARERRLRKVLAELVAALEYTNALDGAHGGPNCNCPLDENDTQCGLCLGRYALVEAKELLR